MATKYAQPEELEFSCRGALQGLGADEAALVDRFFDPGSRVLDVGCGAGREAIALAKRGLRVTAIDVQPAMIEQARLEAARAGVTVTFVVQSVTAFGASPNSFAHVLFSPLVYAYIPSHARRIDTLARLRAALRGGGTIVFSAYNRKAIPSG
ncbi:MAG: class I SAM-dependent methyltransferase, partial [Candidatus Rokuibacteriota bacterium]